MLQLMVRNTDNVTCQKHTMCQTMTDMKICPLSTEESIVTLQEVTFNEPVHALTK